MPVYLSSNNQKAIPELVHLAYAPSSEWDDATAAWLTDHEIQTASMMLSVGRVTEFKLSRYLLKSLYKKINPMSVAECVIQRDLGGKPYANVEGRIIPISVSHSNEFIFVALSLAGSIGLDIERKSRSVSPSLRSRILMDHEFHDERLSQVDTLQLWTVKESILKLTGSGLRQSMSSVSIQDYSNEIDGDMFHTEIDGQQISTSTFILEDHWIAISKYI